MMRFDRRDLLNWDASYLRHGFSNRLRRRSPHTGRWLIARSNCLSFKDLLGSPESQGQADLAGLPGETGGEHVPE